MKVKKLGLKVGKGITHVIAADGRVLTTIDGVSKVTKKLKLADAKSFLYFIDDEGDLAREFRSEPRDRWPEDDPRKPVSAKLDAKALFAKIEALVFPPREEVLSWAGNIEDRKAAARARDVYEKEFARLVKEISIALGPGVVYEAEEDGSPTALWKIRDRAVMLQLTSEDTELPAAIELTRIDAAHVDRVSAMLESSAKKAKRGRGRSRVGS